MKNKEPNHVNIKFQKGGSNSFFNILRGRVDEYFQQNNLDKYANSEMVMKSIVLLSMYIIPFLLLSISPAFGTSLLLWAIMGLAVAGIGMSVMHDANHGSYSPNKLVNYLMAHTLNLLGGSTQNWKYQHNILHHTYTNISFVDDDIQDRLVLKFSPHTPVKKFHQFQWIYAFFFYGLITLYWVIAKDFVQYRQFINKGVNNQDAKSNIISLSKIILIKVLYLSVIFGVPTLVWGITFTQVLIGFLLMHFIAGIILTTVFQLAHTVEHTDHPLPNEEGMMENEWAIHQLRTTVNFSKHNKILSWYIGGLNYQIEHHLFPKISHVHYPKIAHIVKATAIEHGIPYHENKTFFTALKSHIRLLKKLGVVVPNFNEAIG